MASFDVNVTLNTRRARAWLRLIAFIAPIVGTDRAMRWGTWGAYRFTRYRINGGRWLPMHMEQPK